MTPVAPLLTEIEGAGDDRARLIAALWTWLDPYLPDLVSLKRKPHVIRARASSDPFTGWNDRERERLVKAPLPNAAALLARVHVMLVKEKAQPFAALSRGVSGQEVIVVWRRPALAARVGKGTDSPGVVEHPSLATLAPRISVCPVSDRSIKLCVERPEGNGWVAAADELELGMAKEAPTLAVHLDTLGDAGLSGWKLDANDPSVGRFDMTEIDESDEQECLKSAKGAVAAATAPAVLVMPELAATPTVLAGIVTQLEASADAPALTVVGLYHAPSDPVADALDSALIGDEELAGWINEAVVLGPDGKELWRHRKLTCAQAPKKKRVLDLSCCDEDPCTCGIEDRLDLDLDLDLDVDADFDAPLQPAEDIVLGRTLKLVQTPLGLLTVVICLDCFAHNVRERLEHSGADVLLIPSLSPNVNRHWNSLQLLVQRLWAIAFVCNRGFNTPADGGSPWDAPSTQSFWAVQRKPIGLPPKSDLRPSYVFRLDEAV